jgi:hypothetical protein
MATAKKIVIPPVPVEPDYEITLTLSKEEALTLKSVMNDIAPNTGIDFLETK